MHSRKLIDLHAQQIDFSIAKISLVSFTAAEKSLCYRPALPRKVKSVYLIMGISKREREEQEEVVPLTGSTITSPNYGSGSRFLQRLFGMVAIVVFIGFMFVVAENREEHIIAPLDGAGHTHAKISPKQCPKFCNARLAQRIKHQGGDLLLQEDLLALATNSREAMISRMKANYGDDVFKAVFEEPDGTSRGRTVFWGAGDEGENGKDEGPSKARFRRKLKIKLLEVQISINEQESNLSGCNCTKKENRRLQDKIEREVELPEQPSLYSRFVWVTGGHSAAAGHGNLYNESYTAFMERAVKDVFGGVGIDFVGRNYAMGSMSSAPEIALCQESIFGIDADLISEDFGLTDGSSRWKNLLYTNRIGMHPSKPATLNLYVFGDESFSRVDQLKSVEKQGLTTLYMNTMKWTEMKEAIPDMVNKTEEERANVAPYARDFICNNTLERGEPTCDKEKYSSSICVERLGKANWHPGWHVHAAMGSVVALFLTDMLIDAIKELGSDSYNPLEAMDVLLKNEDTDYIKFKNSTLDITAELVKGVVDFDDKPLMEVFTQLFRKTNIICHTALLPAESRFLGIVTESDQVGIHDYYKGVSQESADADNATEVDNDKRKIRLVYNPKERQPSCPVELKWDFKDHFYASESEGWTSLTIPNKAEMDYYAKRGVYEPEGLIMICFVICDWGVCPEENMRFDALKEGKLKLEVNGVPVTNVTMIQDCGLLRHGDRDHYFKPNSKVQFEIKILVEKAEEGKAKLYTRISTIVVL